jgi:hypothetical protein
VALRDGIQADSLIRAEAEVFTVYGQAGEAEVGSANWIHFFPSNPNGGIQ